jgi:hypothetical protein
VRHNSSHIAAIVLLAFFAYWNLTQSARADEERWWGEITDIGSEGDIYTIQIKDGRLFNVVWKNGYSDWDVGDTVILSVDPGFGFMVYGTRHTQVWVEETVEAVPDNGDRASILVPRALTPGASVSVPQLNR